ncbi:anoctamin-like protein At1g73020 isoform X2 [Coffea arabica]|uniref:Anoctamin-like protein At1g73020 isoform X2 n=1 Tax=Coffea arabica TaxID=13443 RepID=A0ABM4U756_COFAR
MKGHALEEQTVFEEEQPVFEIGVVVPKRDEKQEIDNENCVDVLAAEFRKMGLIVERVVGLQNEILKLAAPLAILGKAAAELQLKKRTYIGVDLQFEWDEIDAFKRQPDGSLFSWHERLLCYHHMLYGTVNVDNSIMLKFDNKEVYWEMGESVLRKLELEGIVKEVFPLHDDVMRKQLLKIWALNWWDFTKQPIDEICSYYGMKIATYFAFLGMYTRWLLFPAAFGLILHLIDFGSLQLFVLPVFFVSLVMWAVLFFQFWKRKNSALLSRWQVNQAPGAGREHKAFDLEWSLFQYPSELMKKQGSDKIIEKEVYQREEWLRRFMRYRNDFVVILSIICLQLPFELAYAHLYEVVTSDLLKFGLTVVYLLAIQYFTRIGGKMAVDLVNREISNNIEYRADSLVYKVFGLYFMQSYVGLFYHTLLHRNIMTLRQVLIQRLIFSEVLENLLENSIPYLKYSFKKYRAVRTKRKGERGSFAGKFPRVEKEYLKPAYSASISEELEDGLFDDFLELALQFGMIMMFACAFPLAFTFATLNNITEIRTDALKLLVMLRRPIPRCDATIGAWLNIFQLQGA